jgi:hypothetical protein
MKILKDGKLVKAPMPWWVGILVKCQGCGADIELEETDSAVAASEEHLLGRVLTITFTCPLCFIRNSRTKNIKKLIQERSQQ